MPLVGTSVWTEAITGKPVCGGGGGGTPSVYDDAIALWKLDEVSDGSAPVTRVDSIGSNDLTDNNTVASAAKGVGAPANLPGTVASFVAGNSESLTISDNAALSLGAGGDGAFTVAAWVRVTAMDDENNVLIGKWGGGGNLYDIEYAIRYTSAGYIFQFGDGIGTEVSASDLIDPTSGWALVVGWRDPADGKAYIQVNNDIPVASSASTASHDGNGALAIGRAGSFSAYFISAEVSAAVLWNRVLTSDERAELYNSGDGAPLP